MKRTLIACALTLLSLPLAAQVKDAHSKETPAGVLSLDAWASAEVPNDTAIMTLFVERQAGEAEAAADGAARALDQATRQARAVSGVNARTGGFGTFPSYDRNGKIAGWRSRAELILESKDFARLASLASRLNPLMQIAGVAFTLSREERQREERALIEQAAAAFRDKAQFSTHAFGYERYGIREVQVNTGGRYEQPPVPRMARALSTPAQEAPPLPLEGGRAVVSVQVSGSVQMER